MDSRRDRDLAPCGLRGTAVVGLRRRDRRPSAWACRLTLAVGPRFQACDPAHPDIRGLAGVRAGSGPHKEDSQTDCCEFTGRGSDLGRGWQLPGRMSFRHHWYRPDPAGFGARAHTGFGEVSRQLGEYFAGEREHFDLPVRSAESRMLVMFSPAAMLGMWEEIAAQGWPADAKAYADLTCRYGMEELGPLPDH